MSIILDYITGKDLSPEDLQKVIEAREKSIKTASYQTASGVGTNFYYDFDRICFEGIKEMSEGLKGQRVIELGPGMHPIYEKLISFEIDHYIAVEGFEPDATGGALNVMLENHGDDHFQKVEVVHKDALSYLLEQPDESAVVMSFGMMCPELQNGKNDLYYPFLAKEIHRVTPKDGLTLYVGSRDFGLAHLMKKVGFESIYTRENYQFLGRKK